MEHALVAMRNEVSRSSSPSNESIGWGSCWKRIPIQLEIERGEGWTTVKGGPNMVGHDPSPWWPIIWGRSLHSDGLQRNSDGQPNSDGLQPNSDGLQPNSNGLQPTTMYYVSFPFDVDPSIILAWRARLVLTGSWDAWSDFGFRRFEVVHFWFRPSHSPDGFNL